MVTMKDNNEKMKAYAFKNTIHGCMETGKHKRVFNGVVPYCDLHETLGKCIYASSNLVDILGNLHNSCMNTKCSGTPTDDPFNVR